MAQIKAILELNNFELECLLYNQDALMASNVLNVPVSSKKMIMAISDRSLRYKLNGFPKVMQQADDGAGD